MLFCFKDESARIHLTDLTLSHVCVCPKSGPRMALAYVVVLFVVNDYTVVKELRSKMFGQHPGYFKAVFLKQTR
jgi:hypothetical protein